MEATTVQPRTKGRATVGEVGRKSTKIFLALKCHGSKHCNFLKGLPWGVHIASYTINNKSLVCFPFSVSIKYLQHVFLGSNYASYTNGNKGLVAIFTGSGVVDGQDSNW